MVFLAWEGEDPGRYADFSQALRADGLMVVAIPNRGIRIGFHKDVSEEAAQQAPADEGDAPADENVVDVDYEEVDEK